MYTHSLNRLPFVAIVSFLISSWTSYAQNGWSLVYTPADPSEHYNGIYAVDKNNVVLSSEWGRVYRSTNGCQTVDLFQVPGNYSIFGEIGFTDSQNGFIGGGCWFPFDECISSAMLHTTDGGATWSAQQLGPGIGVLTGVNALPNGEVFVVGDYSGVYHFDPQTGTWDSLGTPAGIVGYHIDLQFLDAENGFLLHHGHDNDTLYRTDNGAVSWTVVNPDIQIVYSGSVHFFDTQHGLLPGTNGILYHTSNGGVTWTPLHEFGINERLQYIDFIDNQTGYIAVFNEQAQQGRILRTDDGGSNWVPELEIANGNFQALHLSDKNNGYAFDSANRIYRRTGASDIKVIPAEISWKVSPNPVSNTLTVSRQSNTASSHAVLFSLFDILGHKVLQQTFAGETAQISCAHLANGVYWYKCGSETGKIIVAR